MKRPLALLTVFILAPQAALHAADAGITWLLHYDGKSLPSKPWTAPWQSQCEGRRWCAAFER